MRFSLQPHSKPSPGLPSAPPAQEQTKLDFAALALFEQVRDQYRDRGISFAGAIAIQPSNPAFISGANSLVLMPIAGKAAIEIYFHRPTHHVEVCVVGAKPIMIRAFDADGQLIAKDSTLSQRCLPAQAHSAKPFPPQQLELAAANIYRIVVDSNAPFVLSTMSWQ
jgi:hypothetical protein